VRKKIYNNNNNNKEEDFNFNFYMEIEMQPSETFCIFDDVSAG
jgi:hypothetical protein